MKYKCIAVRTMTYAQKAKSVLEKSGIDAYLSKRNTEGVSCAWCVKVSELNAGRALIKLKEAGVKLTGEIDDIP